MSRPSLWSYARRQLGLVVGGCAMLLLFNCAVVVLPSLLRRSIDALTAGDGARTRLIALEMIAFACVGALVRIASRVLLFQAGRDAEYAIRRDLFTRLLALAPSYFRGRSTGDVMSRLTNDLNAVRSLLGPALLNVANTAFAYGLALWRLLAISPRLTLVALLPFPLLVGGAQVFSRRIFIFGREVQDRLGDLSSTIQEDLAGIQIVKTYAVEGEREVTFRRANEAYLRPLLAVTAARSAMMPLLAMGGGIATLLVLWIGGRDVIEGRDGMTLSRLVEFNALLAILAWPTLALGFVVAVVQRGRASWSRLAELLAEPVTIADSEMVKPVVAPAVGSIELRDLTLVIGGAARVDRISLTVPAGSTLALVGRTGGGKSTLAEALPRLLELDRGQLFLDGRDLVDLPLDHVRAVVGYAPQESFLFSTSIARNIAFGLRDTIGDTPETDLRVVAAAEAAGLSRDLAALPDGLRTIVGERGITLSGGQRQRVALARALAADPCVLVLDDSLSSVDAETERDILARLKQLRAGRTTVIISHRVAAVREADRIAVIERGRVAESGTHDQLIAAAGIYAELYRNQLLETQIAAVEAIA